MRILFYKIITGVAVSSVLLACKDEGSELKKNLPGTTSETTPRPIKNTADTTAQPTTETKVMNNNQEGEFVEEKKRLESLLSQFAHPLEEESVVVDLSRLNAKYAEGYKVKDQPIKGFAYLFSHQDEHAAAYDFLMANHKNGKYHTMISSNGAWLFWTYSEENTDETQYILFDLVSAFSGEE